jgi:hypothetical protein
MKITTSLPKSLAMSLLILISVAAHVTAATFTVTNTNNSGPGSLRQALTDSNNTAGSDTIVFDPAVFSTPQTIQLANAIQIFPATGDSITITGPGAHLLTIRGNGVDDGSGQIFNRVGVPHALSLSGMTLTNAGGSAVSNNFSGAQFSLTVTNAAFVGNKNGFGGGGISNAAALTVTNCTFTDNVTSPSGGGSGSVGGGAIHSDTNDVTIPVIITGSTFTNNLAGSTFAGSGGAVNNRSGSMTITNSTFTNNRARNGGGAVANGQVLSISGSTFNGNSTTAAGVHGGAVSSVTNGQLTIANSLLTGNSAHGHGGALYASFGGTTTITNSAISGNTSNSDSFEFGSGGGMYFRSDTGLATISGSTISGNQALVQDGGGIVGEANLNLTNSTVSGNFAGANGGGIFDGYTGGPGFSSTITLTSATIVNNTAGANGGGVRQSTQVGDAAVSIRNTIIANNTSGTTANDVSGTFSSQGFNLVRNTTGADIVGATATNLYGVDPNLGPLGNNGGATFTRALLPGSPALDKGNSFGTTTDQRGGLRPHDMPAVPNASGGDGADIGAYEVQPIDVVAAVSRKTHGDAGTFDVVLPLTGDPGIECRNSNGNHTLIFFFTNDVVSGTASITSGVGSVQGTSVADGDLTVNLSGVSDVQQISVTLSNVTDGFGQALPNRVINVGMLVGDTNGTRAVNAGDVLQTRNRSGQTLDSTTFRSDVNVSGSINSGDALAVRGRSGNFIP